VSGTIYVLNEDPVNFVVEYFDNGDPARRSTLQAQWQYFNRFDPGRRQYYKVWLRSTQAALDVSVDHLLPADAPAGRYRVETFVPAKHATTQQAVFLIGTGAHPDDKGEAQLDESLALVDMNALYDTWHPLGEYDLEPSSHPWVGRVRQLSYSREDPPREISFGPVRWVPMLVQDGSGLRYDSPVGTAEERDGPFPSGRVIFGRYPLWAGQWFDVNPFLHWYSYGFHTGADLNLPGASAADKGKPIYAISDGLVTYAGRAGSWGYIIVIEHPEAIVARPEGEIRSQMVYSRYGHVDPNILVSSGETVQRGQNIGFIGLAAGATAGWHLHFDVSYTDILKKRPSYWPDMTAVRTYNGRSDSRGYSSAQMGVMRQVIANFVDPLRFIQDNHQQA
jgi:murein DD-endopeptidase MepM/ murein hydrolase activator NlpD